jgi:hypothetical protein
MTTSAQHPSARRFLARAGIHSRGAEATLLLVIIYGLVEWLMTDRSETALYLVLFVAPFAAGTGLLSTAREGHLDLLLGAGATREAIWWTALLRAVGTPLVACAAVVPMFYGRMSLVELGARALAITLFTAGVAFGAGLRNPRFAAGVAWIAARLVLLMSGLGVKVLAQLKLARSGGANPPTVELVVASVAFPEILLDQGAPALYAFAVALIGIAAIATARAIWVRAELTGRRSA